MQKSQAIQLLNWDTDFFGYKIGLLHATYDIKIDQVLKEARKNSYRLIYIKSDKLINFPSHLEDSRILLADKKVTYSMVVSSITPTDSAKEIQLYNSTEVDTQLLNIALQSGKHSRFYVDNNFTSDEYVKLYTTWINKSVSGEIAKEVWVSKSHTDKISGLITLGIKNNSADIGLLAVDSKYRGKQLGKKLVNKAIYQTQSWGIANLQVVTQLYNIGACRFYESCGFSIEQVEYIYHLWL
jgi:dTDP-4-amino-4,6-dideoxy-D-galactose acyltransferase